MSGITIYDIAIETGYSPATVSRVLNHSRHPVKPEAREKILETASALGYVPNIQARNLKRQISNTLGVIIPSIANPFYPSIVRGIEDETVRRGYHMIVCSSDRDERRTNISIETMMAMNTEGIISIYIDEIPEAMQSMISRGAMALNVVSNHACLPGMHTILVDKKEEAGKAVNYLFSIGHRKIALLMDRIDNSIRTERLEGYREALMKNGVVPDENWVYIYGRDIRDAEEDSARRGYALCKVMLERTPDVTAFVCMNDVMALGALKAVRESGKSIPEDYSMVSFDDLVFADSVSPSLTTVGLDQYIWGKKLAQYYFTLKEKPDMHESVVSEKDVLVTSEIIVRQSTNILSI